MADHKITLKIWPAKRISARQAMKKAYKYSGL